MNILFSKYALAFVLMGALWILIPGAGLYMLGYVALGETLMLIYVIPCGIWAVAALIGLSIEFFRDWKDWDQQK